MAEVEVQEVDVLVEHAVVVVVVLMPKLVQAQMPVLELAEDMEVTQAVSAVTDRE